jgi:lysophospholipase L1-like esterase/pimeloyl-ACP methyl ester carboxylesterase
VGTGITHGTGLPRRAATSYPARLQALLPAGSAVGNFGVHGATLLTRGTAPYVRTREFREARLFLPSAVFIELGTNDSQPANRAFLADIERDCRALIDSFRALPSRPRVILLLPAPAFSSRAGVADSVIRNRITPAIRSAAFAAGCELISLYGMFAESPGLFSDGLHPSDSGAARIAARLAEHLAMEEDREFDLLAAAEITGQVSEYYGFECRTFAFENREARVVRPKRTAAGRPWLWRARFWGHEPQAEIALLERGFHLVYCDVAELFGNNEALGIWDRFYRRLTDAGLSRRASHIAFSRGGVYAYRWAALYPERVSCVYADAPVLDLKSWPGGKGKGHGNPQEWDRFKRDFGLHTENDAIAFRGNPLELAPTIARGGFPMLHVCGTADVTVPIEENTDPFERAILDHNGQITVIRKPGVGHHPHSLADPRPIVEFVLRATSEHGGD